MQEFWKRGRDWFGKGKR